jgi:hypothetical protein
VTAKKYLPTKVQKLLFQFHDARAYHTDCKGLIHYIVFFDGRIFILHKQQLDETDGDVLLETLHVYPPYFTEALLMTLTEKLKNCLRSRT